MTYGYDVLNRLTSATFPNNSSVIYAYDQGANGIGHLTSILDLSGSTSWQYDQHGRVIEKDQTTGAVKLTTKTSYDAAGRISTVRYPSGHIITDLYDPTSGQLTGIEVDGETLVANATYQPFGPIASYSQGNGGSYGRAFDEDGRVSDIVSSGGTKGDSIALDYDINSRIITGTDTLTKTKGYGYDALNRLTNYANGASKQTYTYDADGNRQSLKITALTAYTYAATSNELTKWGAQKEIYDAAGNLLTLGAHTLGYDTLGELVQLKSGKTVLAQYAFNGVGQRVEKSGPAIAGKAVIFSYGDDGRLVGEYGSTGAPIEETVWMGNLPVGIIKGSNLYYINADQLGAPHTITDQKKNIVWEWTPDPFGNGLPNQKPGKAAAFAYNMRFPGQYYDAETRLNYNMARDYNPAIGRYIQSDPMGLSGGVNTFAYVGNNPTINSDRAGLCPDATPDSAPITPIPDRDIPLPPIGEPLNAQTVANITGALGTTQDLANALGIKRNIPFLSLLDVGANYGVFAQNPTRDNFIAFGNSILSTNPAVSIGESLLKLARFTLTASPAY
jgi:RHS repeat-associated protein